jgi:hypothetical protein
VTINRFSRPTPDGPGGEGDSNQVYQNGAERLPAGEPANAGADKGSHAPEEHIPSADSLNIPEVEREGDESNADDDAHGWFHFGDSYANLIICPVHDGQPTESLDQSHHISEHLGHNGNIVAICALDQIAYPFP